MTQPREVSRIARRKALASLLLPIAWPWSSSIEYRRRIVTERRQKVHLVLPFLTTAERGLAKAWLERERHDGLWD